MMKNMLDNVRKAKPLVHNITNYVTVNDCANALLACGASPIMSDDIDEVEEITSLCSALNINIGTLNKRTIPSMLLAGQTSNKLGHPIVLDPVGAGASGLRTKTAKELINHINFTVIRGNVSEIKTLAFGNGRTKGVDADISDVVTKDNLNEAISFAKNFSNETGAIIAVTGEIDIIANSETAYCIFNGNPMMSSITGTGCQLSAIIAAFVSSNPEHVFESAVAAVCTMGVCGEVAHKRLTGADGNASYGNYIIDAMYRITGTSLETLAKYEIF
ncbi:MAG: hydroxyethylthiazole kinase [Suipraeoptans sp.]